MATASSNPQLINSYGTMRNFLCINFALIITWRATHRLSPYPDSYVTDDMSCHGSNATDQSHDLTDVLQAMHRLSYYVMGAMQLIKVII